MFVFPEGGFAEGGLRGWLAFAAGSGLAFAACGAGFYFPKGGCSRRTDMAMAPPGRAARGGVRFL